MFFRAQIGEILGIAMIVSGLFISFVAQLTRFVFCSKEQRASTLLIVD